MSLEFLQASTCMSHTEVFQKRFEKVELFTSSDGRGCDMGKIDKAHVLLPGLEVIVRLKW